MRLRRGTQRIRVFFFFNDTATTEIYTLSLHDALPISHHANEMPKIEQVVKIQTWHMDRSEEHTSELQSRKHLVCRLLLEKKNTQYKRFPTGRAASARTRRRDTSVE